MRVRLQLFLLAACSVIAFTGCGTTPSTSPAISKSAESSLISSLQPSAGSSTSETTIRITFTQDMDPTTLNKNNIQITELKHNSNLIDLYQISYEPNTKTLTQQPKDSQFTFGSENSVTVKVSGKIQDQKGKQMGPDYTWTFKTKN